MGMEDRDKFDGIMGSGGFSQMEQQVGPEMQQTVVEMHKANTAAIYASIEQNSESSTASVKVMESIVQRNTMLSFLLFCSGFLILMLGFSVVILAVKV